jgi:hypothetical protein
MAIDDLPGLVRVDPQHDRLSRAPAQHQLDLVQRHARDSFPPDRHNHVPLGACALPLAHAVFLHRSYAECARRVLDPVECEVVLLNRQLDPSLNILFLPRSVPGRIRGARALLRLANHPLRVHVPTCLLQVPAREVIVLAVLPGRARTLTACLQLLVRRISVIVPTEKLEETQHEEDEREEAAEDDRQRLHGMLTLRMQRLRGTHEQNYCCAEQERANGPPDIPPTPVEHEHLWQRHLS